MADHYPLLPDRHPQGDFFVCDILDAAPKGDVTRRCCRFLPRKFHVLWAEFKEKDILKYF